LDRNHRSGIRPRPSDFHGLLLVVLALFHRFDIDFMRTAKSAALSELSAGGRRSEIDTHVVRLVGISAPSGRPRPHGFFVQKAWLDGLRIHGWIDGRI
jgi:hypothetical protein